jgi:hypothetical protein
MALRIEMLPAQDGDAIWVEWGDLAKGRSRHLLIDAGREETYRTIVDRFRKDPDLALELLVVSHIDIDHVRGAVKLLRDASLSPERLGEVWFNDLRHLPRPRDELGGRDGSFLTRTLLDRGFAWNEAFAGGPICIPDDGPLPVVELPGDLRLTLLGPTRARLSALWARWTDDLKAAELDVENANQIREALEASRTHQPDLLGDDSLESLVRRRFNQDDSPTNGSSIMLLAEHKNASVLLAADGFPGDLEKAILRLLFERKLNPPLEVDAFKVSHHGSRKNTSPELLSLLDCKHFLISTNGTRHGHPDDEAIARIVTARRGGCPKLHFNYRSALNTRWEQLQTRAGFRACYPVAGKEGIAIELRVDPPHFGPAACERSLGAVVVDEALKEPAMGPLRQCTTYRVDVSVRDWGGQAGVRAEPLPAVTADLVDGSALLQVIFWDPQLAPKPQIASLRLPAEGSSSVAQFCFDTTPEHITLRGRIVLCHRQRVLQTGIVACDPSGTRFEIDAAPRPRLSELNGLRAAAALVLDDQYVIASKAAASAAIRIEQEAVNKLVSVLAANLAPVNEARTEPLTLRSETNLHVLHELALRGATLHEAMVGGARGGIDVLSGTGHVQLVSTRVGSFFPAELLYRYVAPQKPVLCDHAERALANGECSSECPRDAADKEAAICPLGFWGLARVVERHARLPPDVPGDADVHVRVACGGDHLPTILPLASPALFGASARAFTAVADPEGAVRDLARHVSIQRAANWEQWTEYVAGTEPRLLVLLPHHEGATCETLEIGGDKLRSDLVRTRHVNRLGHGKPLVLLLGCETQLAAISFESFTTKFLQHGAAIVASLAAGVLGRDAIQIAERIVAALAEIPAGRVRSFGQIALEVRRKLVADGLLVGMALTTYGDADNRVQGRLSTSA